MSGFLAEAFNECSKATKDAYLDGIGRMAMWFGAPADDLVRHLLASDENSVGDLAFQWENDQVTREVPQQTIQVGMSALRKLLRVAYARGHWAVHALTPPGKYCGYQKLQWLDAETEDLVREAAVAERNPIKARNRLLLHLMLDLGAKPQEIADCRVGDWDPNAGLTIGAGEKRVTFEAKHCDVSAFTKWLRIRGTTKTKWLFRGFGPASDGIKPIASRTIHRICKDIGAKVKLEKLTPTILRNTAIFKWLKVHNGNILIVGPLARLHDLNIRHIERKIRYAGEAPWSDGEAGRSRRGALWGGIWGSYG